MLKKYLFIFKYYFYGCSYFIKKYDKLWDVGETYYVFGAGHIGILVYAYIMDIVFLVGIIFFYNDMTFYLESISIYTKYLSAITFVLSILYFKYKNRHEKIYNEVKSLKGKKKKIYKILNIIHVLVIYVLLFSLLTIVRNLRLQ